MKLLKILFYLKIPYGHVRKKKVRHTCSNYYMRLKVFSVSFISSCLQQERSESHFWNWWYCSDFTRMHLHERKCYKETIKHETTAPTLNTGSKILGESLRSDIYWLSNTISILLRHMCWNIFCVTTPLRKNVHTFCSVFAM